MVAVKVGAVNEPSGEAMRAIVQHETGGPEVLKLETVPRPSPGLTEVLVRVKAAGVNPADWKNRRSGSLITPPFTPGWDLAGVVEEVGFGVTRFEAGDRVFGMPAFPHEAGAYAEFATARSRELARIPDGVTDEQAGAVPLAGLTAWQALVDTAQVTAGTRVLILAAAGGVGHIAVQVAKARGAYVVGTGRQHHHDALRELGIDEVIDQTSTDVGQAAKDIDVLLDLVGGQAGLDALPALRDDGLFINIPSGSDSERVREAASGRVRVTNLLVEPDQVGMEAISALLAEGKLKVRVGHSFPLEEAAEAQELVEKGETGGGKVVITTEPSA